MRIKSFEEACEKRGYDPSIILPDFSMYPEPHRKALIAAAKLFIITEAINEGHEFNWNDRSERKWGFWIDMEVDDNNPTGFRFYDAYYVSVHTSSAGGSRLCYRTEEDAVHAFEDQIDLWRDMMVVPKKVAA